MKNRSFIISLLVILASCQPHNDTEYFNGEIQSIKSHHCIDLEVISKKLLLDGTFYGKMYIYDSLLFFHNPKLKSQTFNVCNVKTGREIGTFCERGGGPQEAYVFSPVYYIYNENGHLKAPLFAPNEEELFTWNISKSIQQNKTFYEKTSHCIFKDESDGAFFQEVFFLNPDTLLAQIGTRAIGDDDATLPYYLTRSINNNTIKKYYPFKKTIKNGEATIIPEAFYGTHCAIKPDKTTLVEAMRYLPQINFINLQTGEIKGFRMKGGEDFSIFKKTHKDLKLYFCNITADDNYIYAVYYGKYRPKKNEKLNTNQIYIFNWEGELKYRLTTDCNIFETVLDDTNNRLYMSIRGEDEVRYIELNEAID